MPSRNIDSLTDGTLLNLESIAEAIETATIERFQHTESSTPSKTVIKTIEERVQQEQEWSAGALRTLEELFHERAARKAAYLDSLSNIKKDPPAVEKPVEPATPVEEVKPLSGIAPFDGEKKIADESKGTKLTVVVESLDDIEIKSPHSDGRQVSLQSETATTPVVKTPTTPPVPIEPVPAPTEPLPPVEAVVSPQPTPVAEKPVESVEPAKVESPTVSVVGEDEADGEFDPSSLNRRERRKWEREQKRLEKEEHAQKLKEAKQQAALAKAGAVAPAKEKKQKQGGLFGRKKQDNDDLATITDDDMREVTGEGDEKQPIEITTGADTAGATKDLERKFREEDLLFKRDRTKPVNHQTWFEEAMASAVIMGASDFLVNTENYDAEDADEIILQCRVRIDGEMRDYDFMRGTVVRQVMGVMQATAGFESGRANRGEETIIDVLIDGEKRKGRAAMEPNVAGGQTLVIRLPLTGELKQLHELKFADYNLELIYKLLAMPGKLVMLAGPMGSGKTTTAHGALLHVNTPGKTVWTIEDPVERRLPNLYQMEVNNAEGVAHSFGDILRLTLRLDYNTLFLGEIRDTVTASAAVMQAKVGRQIISTIHADNNILALQRLIELSGDTPLGALSAAGGVISQRLVRMLNPAWDGKDPSTKYKGRVPIHEILIVNDNLIEVMASGASQSEIRNAVAETDHSTFVQDAHRLMEAGISDREELEKTLGVFPKADWEE